MTGNTTLPDHTEERQAGNVVPSTALVPTLVLVSCAEADQRVGEVVVLVPGDPGPWGLIGRGDAQQDDPHPRLQLVRARPGRLESGGPLQSARISRVQLAVRARGVNTIEVRQLGRLPLLHRGREVQQVELAPGETLAVGSQLMFLAVQRPPLLIAAAGNIATFPFGEADPHGIVGESPAIWSLRARIAFVAARDEHVLVTGASGTGKELVARAVHAASARARRPLLGRNAATFPEGLIDAELFGNARNYPNSGMPERAGLVGEADGSTLLLDEIAELTPELQAHLLRVLDRGEYQRLGEARTRTSDLRLVGATNRPLAALKHDLLARLLLRIDVPDLNARPEDVPLIARHLLRASDAAPGGGDARHTLSPAVLERLLVHRYTTHVRELKAMLLDALAEPSSAAPPATPATPIADPDPRVAAGQTAADIQRCLDYHRGNLEIAWRELGLSSRHALVRLIAKHGLRAGRRWRPREG